MHLSPTHLSLFRSFNHRPSSYSLTVFFLVVLLISHVFLSNAAQAADRLFYNVVSLQATAEREVENDLMQVSLSIEHQNIQSSQAAARVNQDSHWALDLAKKYPAVKARTQNYSTYPRYEKRRMIGWIVRQQLFLESEDFEQLAELVTDLQKKLQVDQMSFRPTRATRLAMENELTAEALKAFQKKAELITQSMGKDKYEVLDVQLGGGPHFRPMRNQSDMARTATLEKASVTVESGSSNLRVTASGRIQLR